ncbi:Zinc finger MYM-type protein 1 [Holothuria leucospilota]|uniref:Zinc finger MYM-type protein 1 n=1 Tax=Holothuria leucospilota TaxID=206669 RepID=A0A9Q1H4P4_HOLLE|nr:Zinc finger MYM-type protein 1 [Holothuria leucospilota]
MPIFCDKPRTSIRKNWFPKLEKKIGDKCQKHNHSDAHKTAAVRLTERKLCLTSGRGTILDQINPETSHTYFVERNRGVLKTVLDLVLFCSKQDIPLRGHENSESLNHGNFLELPKLIFNYSPEQKKKFEELPKNAKMKSPGTQNDLLESAASVLMTYIRKEVNAATYFAILADECKDASKREIVGVSLRYIFQGKVKERAIGFVETEELNATAISSKIMEALSIFKLDRDKCIGFSFDGASVMSGIKGGVQTILRRKFPKASYTHCHSHRLNLVMSATCQSYIEFKNVFDLLDQLVTFFTATKRHAKFIELQRSLYPNA